MSMKMGLLWLATFSSMAFAEEKTCAVKGMHCKACTEMVEGKVCGAGDTYATCEVKILNEKKEMGQVHLVTKDKAQKIDEKALGAVIEDAGYHLSTCHLAGKGA